MRVLRAIGPFFLCTGTIFGAVGAHILRERLDPAAFEIFRQGVLYQLINGAALFAYPVVLPARPLPALLLSAGTLLFSAGLYSRAILGPGGLAAAAPLGGILMILSWAIIMLLSLRADCFDSQGKAKEPILPLNK